MANWSAPRGAGQQGKKLQTTQHIWRGEKIDRSRHFLLCRVCTGSVLEVDWLIFSNQQTKNSSLQGTRLPCWLIGLPPRRKSASTTGSSVQPQQKGGHREATSWHTGAHSKGLCPGQQNAHVLTAVGQWLAKQKGPGALVALPRTSWCGQGARVQARQAQSWSPRA